MEMVMETYVMMILMMMEYSTIVTTALSITIPVSCRYKHYINSAFWHLVLDGFDCFEVSM